MPRKVKGQGEVVDPTDSMTIHLSDAEVVVVSGNQATIFGDATVNGVSTNHRIDVVDNGSPGVGHDIFEIQTGTGYRAGGILTGGNVTIH